MMKRVRYGCISLGVCWMSFYSTVFAKTALSTERLLVSPPPQWALAEKVEKSDVISYRYTNKANSAHFVIQQFLGLNVPPKLFLKRAKKHLQHHTELAHCRLKGSYVGDYAQATANITLSEANQTIMVKYLAIQGKNDLYVIETKNISADDATSQLLSDLIKKVSLCDLGSETNPCPSAMA